MGMTVSAALKRGAVVISRSQPRVQGSGMPLLGLAGRLVLRESRSRWRRGRRGRDRRLRGSDRCQRRSTFGHDCDSRRHRLPRTQRGDRYSGHSQAVAAAAGNLYVTDSQLSVVREINSAGVETVIAATGRTAIRATAGRRLRQLSTIPKVWPSTARATS